MESISEREDFFLEVQVFLDFRGFNIRDLWFDEVNDSMLFSSLLVSNLDLRDFASAFFLVSPH